MRTRLAVLAAVCLVVIGGAAVARAQITRSVGSGVNVRVLGRFLMSGTVSIAVGIPGEQPGEQLARTWRVRPYDCEESYCPRIVLVRNRGAQRESKLTLHRIGAGAYRGTGSFFVPLKCLGRTYQRGSLAPYVITLRVTQWTQRGAVRYATRIYATYVNTQRSDRTRCPLGVVHDAAHYRGELKSALPPAPVTTTTTTPVPTTPAPVPVPTVPVPNPTVPVPTTTTPAPTTTTDTTTVPLLLSGKNTSVKSGHRGYS